MNLETIRRAVEVLRRNHIPEQPEPVLLDADDAHRARRIGMIEGRDFILIPRGR